jgi:hypothetical protein
MPQMARIDNHSRGKDSVEIPPGVLQQKFLSRSRKGNDNGSCESESVRKATKQVWIRRYVNQNSCGTILIIIINQLLLKSSHRQVRKNYKSESIICAPIYFVYKQQQNAIALIYSVKFEWKPM